MQLFFSLQGCSILYNLAFRETFKLLDRKKETFHRVVDNSLVITSVRGYR